MKGVVVTSHGPLAKGIIETSKLFMGEQKQLVARCLFEGDSPDAFVDVLKDAIKEVDTGDGVIVLCDMFFGSPCNCMARIIGADLDNDSIDVLTGLNLAMLIQVLATRESGNVNLEEVIDSGKQGIADLKKALIN